MEVGSLVIHDNTFDEKFHGIGVVTRIPYHDSIEVDWADRKRVLCTRRELILVT